MAKEWGDRKCPSNERMANVITVDGMIHFTYIWNWGMILRDSLPKKII